MSDPPFGVLVSPHPSHTVNRPRYVATLDTCERSRDAVIADCWGVIASHGRVFITPREQRHGCVGNGDASLREHRHGRNFAGSWADACTAEEALP